MLDGPVVAGIVFVVGGALVGGYFYVDHVRHGRSSARAPKAVERLPLFGIDQLGTTDDGSPADPAATPRPSIRAVPRNGAPMHPANGNGGFPYAPDRSPFAPPGLESAPPADAGSHPAHAPLEIPIARVTPRPLPGSFPGQFPGMAPMPQPGYGRGGSFGMTASPARSAFAEGETVRFALPDDGTLQFLPGRLQVLAGPDTGREIRFVRSPDTKSTDVTFGRSEGPPHRHVQLLARTVSRRHALMSLIDEHWSLQNLSATNPVIVNGRPLLPDEVVPLLVDGDRIEMGEVVFAFHSR